MTNRIIITKKHEYLLNKLIFRGSFNNRTLRSNNTFDIIAHRTQFIKRSFTYNAIISYNSIDVADKHKSCCLFKKSSKAGC